MYRDDSNGGGGEPWQGGHPPILSLVETAFVGIHLNLPMMEGKPERPTEAKFTVGMCGHGQMVVDVKGCLIVPLPRNTNWRGRLKIGIGYVLGRWKAPPMDAMEGTPDGA